MHMHGTGREEEHVVEIMPDRGARLVQRGHRREMALDGEVPDEAHHAARLVRVQAGGGLVGDQGVRLTQQLAGEREPPPLAARDALVGTVAHTRVTDVP